MRYRYIVEGPWIYYWFVGNRFLGTWKVAILFIMAGIKLGLTGKTMVCLPHDRGEVGK